MTSPARPACARRPRGSPTGTRCCASWHRESASMPVGWLPRCPPSPARAGVMAGVMAAPVRAAVDAVRVVWAAIAQGALAREAAGQEMAGQEMAGRTPVQALRVALRRADQAARRAPGRALRDALRRHGRARPPPVDGPRVRRPSQQGSQGRAGAPDVPVAAVAPHDGLTAPSLTDPDPNRPATSRIGLSNSQPRSPIRHLAGDERSAFPSGAWGERHTGVGCAGV